MRTFIAITITDRTYDVLDDCINSLLMNPLKKEIHVFDATSSGVDNDVKSFFRAYSKFKVFLHRVKQARNIESGYGRLNMALAESVMLFQHKSDCNAYLHIAPNVFFQGHGLQILSDTAQLYNCVSPVVQNRKGLEVMDGVADRFGYNSFDKDLASISFINGQVEETFSVNYKCFGMSDRYARKIAQFWKSSDHPTEYINQLLFEFADSKPKVDTNTFVLEHLY